MTDLPCQVRRRHDVIYAAHDGGKRCGPLDSYRPLAGDVDEEAEAERRWRALRRRWLRTLIRSENDLDLLLRFANRETTYEQAALAMDRARTSFLRQVRRVHCEVRLTLRVGQAAWWELGETTSCTISKTAEPVHLNAWAVSLGCECRLARRPTLDDLLSYLSTQTLVLFRRPQTYFCVWVEDAGPWCLDILKVYVDREAATAAAVRCKRTAVYSLSNFQRYGIDEAGRRDAA